tara:strand:- start:323 stop:982 length:660 start_codon:yes stop_codon:yes gene_type:complete
MNTGEVAALFRGYTDEADKTFLTDANVKTYLDIGYRQFRRYVNTLMPGAYAEQVDISLSNANSYDLATGAVKLLGPTAVTRMHKLLTVSLLDSNNEVSLFYTAAGTREVMLETIVIGGGLYYFENTTLYFPTKLTETLRLTYVPEPTVDFSAAADFIDDYQSFHDLIALLAYDQYAVRDSATNEQLASLLGRRVVEFQEYLAVGRVPEAGAIVIDGQNW